MCAFRREHRVCPQPGTETWRSRDRDTVFLVDQTALVFLDIFTKDEDPLPSRRASSRKTANSSSDAEAEGNGKRSRGRLEPTLPPLHPRGFSRPRRARGGCPALSTRLGVHRTRALRSAVRVSCHASSDHRGAAPPGGHWTQRLLAEGRADAPRLRTPHAELRARGGRVLRPASPSAARWPRRFSEREGP